MKRFDLSVLGGVVFASLLSQPATAQCQDHWTIASDDFISQAFCDEVDKANRAGLIPVMRKPRCPRNGPSSKCNPSSIVTPDFETGALIIMRPDGSYSTTVLGQPLTELFIMTYEQDMVDAGHLPGVDSDWRLTPSGSLDHSEDAQVILMDTMPWGHNAIRAGGTAFVVFPEVSQ